METRDQPASARPGEAEAVADAQPATTPGNGAPAGGHMVVKAPHEGHLITEPGPEDLDEGVVEERRVPRVIPRVEPRTTDDLATEAPTQQRYPVKISRSLRNLWGARELVFGLVERDLRVRYKQALLGVFWAVLNPLLTMVLFSFVFGNLAKFSQTTGGVPYPLFAYSALVPWSLFQSATNYSINSIIANAPIVRKIYCPREVFPIGAVISSSADFLISMAILFLMCFAYGYYPTWTWLALIPLLLVLWVLMLALALFLSATVAYFRDVRYIVPSVLQALLFLTPIAYSMQTLQQRVPLFQNNPHAITIYKFLNPLAPIIDGFRRALVGTPAPGQTVAHTQWPEWVPFLVAAAYSTIALMWAYWWYKRRDGYLADVI
ncbi:MAG TPA: ABC transporter permease [Actinomycetota bacterium]|nr:ABC transporter permease [Actinomycetota bacterium]